MALSRREFVNRGGVGRCSLAPWYAFATNVRAADSRHDESCCFPCITNVETGIPANCFNIDRVRLGDCVLRNPLFHFCSGLGAFFGKVRTQFTHRRTLWHSRLTLLASRATTVMCTSDVFDPTMHVRAEFDQACERVQRN